MKTSQFRQALGRAAIGFASLSTAQFTFSPGSNGPTYSIAVPSGSSISSSSTGPLYFRLEAPTSYQWVALGIGSQMAGSSIFVMYADGNGNVTLSARKGTGEVEPKADSTLQAGVELLAGTGISNGKMAANVKCTSCRLQSTASAPDSPWIAAWSTGSAINSASNSATLRQHSPNSRVEAQIDLSRASISSDSNPFLSGGAATPGTGSGSPATNPSSGQPAGPGSNGSGPGSGNDNDGKADGKPKGNSNSNNGGITIGGSGSKANAIPDYQKAHGIIMGVVVVLLFPFGAMFVRMGGSGIVHGILQILSLCALLVGLGLGIKLADLTGKSLTSTHPLFGLIIGGLFLIQPIFGIIHHLQYKRNFARAGVSHVHIWYGRILMVLAVINGGLGLKLACNSKAGAIAYGVIAGLVGVVYIAMCLFKRKGSNSGPFSHGLRKEEIAPASGIGGGAGQGGYAMPDVAHYGNGHAGAHSQAVAFK
ncbi:uncharacterized protein RCO7_01521 [Rhynchosporium graminicola]|uniref:DOMON domain-containing protein n=1 Tax=Rhynchosporium graminicola TaxID=2792576 RepID=A0A1E1JZH6_9HELO|nr:uncharacterized protein RCO7_01521 [Rhynchosporium commune]